MDKWADYLISRVRFNSSETHIDKVEVYPDNGDKLGVKTEFTRQTVIALIDKGYTFATIFKNGDGKWDMGAHVEVVPIEGIRYIKTYADSTKRDNLDNLPRF
jgi:hypothetical protein